MCEPRYGMTIQSRIRNLGLSITRGRLFSRSCDVLPMRRSRGASSRAAVLKPGMAMARPSRSWTASRAGRVFAGHQAEEAHQLARVVEASEGAEFGQHGDGRKQVVTILIISQLAS